MRSNTKQSREARINDLSCPVLDGMALDDIYPSNLETWMVRDILESVYSPNELRDVDQSMLEDIVDFIKKNY